MLPGDITKYLLPLLISLRLSVIRFPFVTCPDLCISLFYLSNVLLLFSKNINLILEHISQFYPYFFVHIVCVQDLLSLIRPDLALISSDLAPLGIGS
mgnify:CR=1 FL=1